MTCVQNHSNPTCKSDLYIKLDVQKATLKRWQSALEGCVFSQNTTDRENDSHHKTQHLKFLL